MVAWAVAVVLMIVLVGPLLIPVLAVGELIYVILACINSYDGEWFGYPLVGAWARRQVGA